MPDKKCSHNPARNGILPVYWNNHTSLQCRTRELRSRDLQALKRPPRRPDFRHMIPPPWQSFHSPSPLLSLYFFLCLYMLCDPRVSTPRRMQKPLLQPCSRRSQSLRSLWFQALQTLPRQSLLSADNHSLKGCHRNSFYLRIFSLYDPHRNSTIHHYCSLSCSHAPKSLYCRREFVLSPLYRACPQTQMYPFRNKRSHSLRA